MTDSQSVLTVDEDRTAWLVESLRPTTDYIMGRWYAANTREPIRDETLREGLIRLVCGKRARRNTYLFAKATLCACGGVRRAVRPKDNRRDVTNYNREMAKNKLVCWSPGTYRN